MRGQYILWIEIVHQADARSYFLSETEAWSKRGVACSREPTDMLMYGRECTLMNRVSDCPSRLKWTQQH